MGGFVDMTVDGADDIQAALLRIENGEVSIARAAVSASLSVLAQAAANASPGTIKQETGKYVRVEGDRVWGRAGLIQFPRRGDGQNGPHGVYLDQGTKFIAARHFIGNALRANKSRALNAGQRAAARRVRQLAGKK